MPTFCNLETPMPKKMPAPIAMLFQVVEYVCLEDNNPKNKTSNCQAIANLAKGEANT